MSAMPETPVAPAPQPKAKAPVLLIVLLVAALIGCAVFAALWFTANKEAGALAAEQTKFSEQLASEQAALADLEAQIEANKASAKANEEALTALEDSAYSLGVHYGELLDEQILMSTVVTIATVETETYHFYTCEDLHLEESSGYYIADPELAEAIGLVPCPKCITE